MGRISFDLATQAVHHLPQHVPVTTPCAPNVFDDSFRGQHMPGVEHQIVEQSAFQRGQADRFALIKSHFSATGIEGQCADLADAGRGRLSGPTEHCLRPRHELAGAEWLGDVIVGAQLQTAHDVILFTPHGQQQNRRVILLADALADREAVDFRQIDVQDNQVGLLICPALQSLFAIAGLNDLKTGAPQSECEYIR